MLLVELNWALKGTFASFGVDVNVGVLLLGALWAIILANVSFADLSLGLVSQEDGKEREEGDFHFSFKSINWWFI